MTALIERKELLIHGFIRDIGKLLKHNTIIPLELIEACNAFYSIGLKIFIIACGSDSKYVSNIDNQTISKLKDLNLDILSSCYIPDISQYITISNDNQELAPNKYYDGIVGICKSENPFILLLGSNMTDYHLYISSQRVPSMRTYVSTPYLKHCNDHGVIYSDEGLYQLKWEDIDIRANKFNFTAFGPKNKTTDCYGSIGYIYNEQKLFVMEGYTFFDHFFMDSDDDDDANQPKIVRNKSCGILDLNTTQWIDVKQFKYTIFNYNKLLKIGIAQNNYYNTNAIYVVSNMNHTAKYDINKNEWEMILDGMEFNDQLGFNEKPMVWMDSNPHILWCHSGSYFRFLDLRGNKRKWYINHYDMHFILNKTKNESIRIFL